LFSSILPLFGNQVDRLLAFIDLDPSLVSEEARTALSSRLEAVAMQQDQFLILFAKEEDRVVELSLAASSSYLGPRCLFIKQLHTSAKVSSCGRSWNCCQVAGTKFHRTVFKNLRVQTMLTKENLRKLYSH
jgi:hypothetical protein